MARKPNYIMKPADFIVTEMGFKDSGEGIVIDYEKGNPVIGNKLGYYMLVTSRDKPLFVYRTIHLTPPQARKNIEIKDDFSDYFKRSLLRMAFEEKKDHYRENIKQFIRYL